SPFSQDGPQFLPSSSGVLASLVSYKNPFKVSLPWCSASHEVARGDSPAFSSTANCRLSASAPPTFVPRIGRSPVRGFFSILSAVSCKLSTARPERSRRVNCFAHFALCYLVPFHANTNCPICKSFVLITMQIAGGWESLCGN